MEDSSSSGKQIHERQAAEQLAWDGKSAGKSYDLASLDEEVEGWRRWFDVVLAQVGPLEGKRALDCGCGMGALTRMVASEGTLAIGFDISSESLRVARAIEKGQFTTGYVHSAFESLPFVGGAFDVAVGMFVLHHVDLATASIELARVLAPGGRASFIETWQQNPVLRAARRFRGKFGIAMWGTADERPLGPADLQTLSRAGFDCRLEFPAFAFFTLISRNIVKGNRRFRLLDRLFGGIDVALSRIKWLRHFGYYCIIHLVKTDRPAQGFQQGV